MVGAIGFLMAAAFVAGTIPARKAASINPAETLKAE
jgi:ABC-type lipoprotein release transport system permease subunit